MKKTFILFIVTFFIFQGLHAQSEEDVSKQRAEEVQMKIDKLNEKAATLTDDDLFTSYIKMEDKSMSGGRFPALVVGFNDLKSSEVKAAYNYFIKQFGKKPKKIKKTQEFWVEGTRMNGIGDGKPVNVYNTFQTVGETIQTIIWVKKEGDVYVSESDDDYDDLIANAETYLNILKFFKTENDLKAEEKMLKEQKKELSDSEKEKEKAIKAVAEYEQKLAEEKQNIINAEDAIEINQGDVQIQDAARNIVESRLNEFGAKTGLKRGNNILKLK